jgi:hypothetical protein
MDRAALIAVLKTYDAALIGAIEREAIRVL